MQSQRDIHNNNNSTAQQQFSSAVAAAAARQNLSAPAGTLHLNPTMIDSTSSSYPSLLAQNRRQQQQQQAVLCNSDLLSTGYNISQKTYPSMSSPSKLAHNNNNVTNGAFQIPPMARAMNPFASVFTGDSNQLSAAIQACLTNAQKLGGGQLPAQMMQADASNPLLYLQLMNANAMFMQQLATWQNNVLATAVNTAHYDPNKQSTQPRRSSTTLFKQQTSLPNVESVMDKVGLPRKSQVLQADSNIFVPKTRSMTQEEIAEHARLVYERALHRNQLQQQNDLMKHLYETLNCKQQDSDPVGIRSTNSSSKMTNISSEVPSVPNSTNMTSSSALDVLDTLITPSVPSRLCPSTKEPSIDTVLSSSSLLSIDDVKLAGGLDSTLDPGAPIFVPRRIRSKRDDDIDTSSSSSDSDFNDFHYLDQFLDEIYDENNRNNNHLIINKCSSSETIDASSSGSNANKHTVNHHALGQGDATEEQKPECAAVEQSTEQQSSPSVDKKEHQYSIYELLDRYRNPRCHLVLPEWSRLSLILANVCSMRSHTYKVKRYFAYRRRLREDQEYFQVMTAHAQDYGTTELNSSNVELIAQG